MLAPLIVQVPRHACFASDILLKMPTPLIIYVMRHDYYIGMEFYILQHFSAERDKWMLVFADTCALE